MLTWCMSCEQGSLTRVVELMTSRYWVELGAVLPADQSCMIPSVNPPCLCGVTVKVQAGNIHVNCVHWHMIHTCRRKDAGWCGDVSAPEDRVTSTDLPSQYQSMEAYSFSPSPLSAFRYPFSSSHCFTSFLSRSNQLALA